MKVIGGMSEGCKAVLKANGGYYDTTLTLCFVYDTIPNVSLHSFDAVSINLQGRKMSTLFTGTV